MSAFPIVEVSSMDCARKTTNELKVNHTSKKYKQKQIDKTGK